MMKRCLKCKNEEFITTANVSQEWLVNSGGLCIKVLNDFVDIVNDIDDLKIWECSKCGYKAKGSIFNVEE